MVSPQIDPQKPPRSQLDFSVNTSIGQSPGTYPTGHAPDMLHSPQMGDMSFQSVGRSLSHHHPHHTAHLPIPGYGHASLTHNATPAPNEYMHNQMHPASIGANGLGSHQAMDLLSAHPYHGGPMPTSNVPMASMSVQSVPIPMYEAPGIVISDARNEPSVALKDEESPPLRTKNSKKSRNKGSDEERKARGRPRLDTQDETATDVSNCSPWPRCCHLTQVSEETNSDQARPTSIQTAERNNDIGPQGPCR